MRSIAVVIAFVTGLGLVATGPVWATETEEKSCSVGFDCIEKETGTSTDPRAGDAQSETRAARPGIVRVLPLDVGRIHLQPPPSIPQHEIAALAEVDAVDEKIPRHPVLIRLGNGVVIDGYGEIYYVPTMGRGEAVWDLSASPDNLRLNETGFKGRIDTFDGVTTAYGEGGTRRIVSVSEDGRTVKIKNPFKENEWIRIDISSRGTRINYGGKRSVDVRTEGKTTTIRGAQGKKASVRHRNGGVTVRRTDAKVVSVEHRQEQIIVSGAERMVFTLKSGGIEQDSPVFLGDVSFRHDGNGGITVEKVGPDSSLSKATEEALEETRQAIEVMIARIKASDPDFERNRPILAAVLEYARHNEVFRKSKAFCATTYGAMGIAYGGKVLSDMALAKGASAMAMANQARQLGAVALQAKQAAMVAAQGGNLAGAAQLGAQARAAGSQALGFKDKAITTGHRAEKIAVKARVLTGLGGILAMADGVKTIREGQRAFFGIEGAMEVAQRKMDTLEGRLEGEALATARKDYDEVQALLQEWSDYHRVHADSGGFKTAGGFVMFGSAIVAAPPIGMVGSLLYLVAGVYDRFANEAPAEGTILSAP